jgi:hypothetical protein
MDVVKKLKKAFPGHDIQMKEMAGNIGVGTCSIYYDGNLLRIKFQVWSEALKNIYHRDAELELIERLITDIKFELSQLPKKV